MKIVLYKLYNTATGKWNAGADHWTSVGKCWNQRNHLTTKLTQYALWQVSMFSHRGYPPPDNTITREERRYYENKENREALYKRFIPETWVVIEITENGARELCKAQDWLSLK